LGTQDVENDLVVFYFGLVLSEAVGYCVSVVIPLALSLHNRGSVTYVISHFLFLRMLCLSS